MHTTQSSKQGKTSKVLITHMLLSIVSRRISMNGRLDKVAMTDRLMKLKRELHYKCEIGEKGKWECVGANEYLNKTFDILDEYWQ
tara:strand:- start:352 stop:606 length:255 start_codon:yes stop_codon:yes gene_type:complete